MIEKYRATIVNELITQLVLTTFFLVFLIEEKTLSTQAITYHLVKAENHHVCE